MSADSQNPPETATFRSTLRTVLSIRHPKVAWIVLAISLFITWFAFDMTRTAVIDHSRERFRLQTEDIKTAIAKRMRDQEIALRGGVGLFAVHGSVTRAQWKTFVELLDLGENFPGLQGFGYAELIEPHRLDAHIASIRAEGFADFTLRPPGRRDIYTSITLLEPFDWRNKRAFGFDMFSEPQRREAMERARDTGAPAATGMVTLVQETNRDVQRGFLLYLPVYRSGEVPDGVERRRDGLTGYVYSPFRMNDLMGGILGAGDKDIHFDIFDGRQQRKEQHLYRSGEPDGTSAPSTAGELARTTVLEFAGRQWTLVFSAKPGYTSAAERRQPLLIGGAGLLIDALVFFVISFVSGQTRRAESKASEFSVESRSQSIRNRAIVNTVRDGIVTVTADLKIQTCNNSASRIFGYHMVEMLGQNLLSLISEPTANRLAFAIKQDGAAEQSLFFGLTDGMIGLRKDGTVFPLEISITSMEVDETILSTVVFRDLTEQQRIDRMKSEFVSVVSHELRTPLTSMLGSLSLMQSGLLGAIPEAAEKALSIANSNAKRLINLVNDIIDTEQMKAGKYAVTLKPTDIAKTVRSAVEHNEAYANKLDVSVNLDIFSGAAKVMADSERLAQVLDNLISNAIKFSPEGESVDVCVLEHEDLVRIEVHDLGPGIPDDLQEKIFEPFFQIETSNNRGTGGAGLGLAIAKTIIGMHNTTIRVSSQTGVGTCMWFDLKKVDEMAGKPKAKAPKTSRSHQPA